MIDNALRTQLETLHPESYGWALCCCRRDRHRAEDVLQRVYLKVLDGTARFDGHGSFKTWLFAVIRMTALDERRRQWLGVFRLLAYSQHRPTPPQDTADDTLDRPALQVTFQAALAQLATRQREVLHLVFYQDLSLAQAAQVMGISVGSARQHYDRGKMGLRQWLGNLDMFQERNHERPA